ncbi:hypothetical protein [Shimia haliotis]|uniref:hypothetical protein n=1 Tax=Shimia haliotis TaxID=1280847 RepID=UPI001BAFB8E8|nr:hypothetical protein [Shimia haliotis]
MERKASAAIVIAALAAAFWAGSEVQKAAYLDQCLDLGGGQNPGNHPIWVIEQAPPSLQLGPVVIAAQGGCRR